MKQQIISATTKTPNADPFDDLRQALLDAIAKNDAGLLWADSSQAQFNATRLLLTGRREVLEAVTAYLRGDPSLLMALAES